MAKVIFIIISIILLMMFIPLVAIWILGSTSIDERIPVIGIDVINIPFSGESKETIPLQWLVQGQPQDAPLITGIYFAKLPSQADFTTETNPADAGYTGFVPASEIVLPDGTKVLQGDLPNVYSVNYARIYALINGKHYWSDEFILEAS